MAANYSNTVHGDLRHEGERRPRQFSMRSMKGGQTVKWIGIFPPFIRRVAVNLKIWRLTPGGFAERPSPPYDHRARMSFQDNAEHPHISLAHLPPTRRQTWSALAGAAVLLLGLVVLAPFAAKPLPHVNGFMPAMDATISHHRPPYGRPSLRAVLDHAFESAFGAGVWISVFSGDCRRARAELSRRLLIGGKFRREQPRPRSGFMCSGTSAFPPPCSPTFG